MNELLIAFNLMVAIDPEKLHFDIAWTFRSSMGVCRQIDFILADRGFYVNDVFATNILDMGSDHRAVFTELRMRRRISRKWTAPGIQKRWRPDDVFTNYVEAALTIGNETVESITRIINDG